MGEPVPDEYCPHIENGAEMTGGWYFAARNPPVAVGMCHNCIVWCRTHFDADGQMSWDEYTDGILDAEVIE